MHKYVGTDWLMVVLGQFVSKYEREGIGILQASLSQEIRIFYFSKLIWAGRCWEFVVIEIRGSVCLFIYLFCFLRNSYPDNLCPSLVDDELSLPMMGNKKKEETICNCLHQPSIFCGYYCCFVLNFIFLISYSRLI